jgi:hypothetical protein
MARHHAHDLARVFRPDRVEWQEHRDAESDSSTGTAFVHRWPFGEASVPASFSTRGRPTPNGTASCGQGVSPTNVVQMRPFEGLFRRRLDNLSRIGSTAVTAGTAGAQVLLCEAQTLWRKQRGESWPIRVRALLSIVGGHGSCKSRYSPERQTTASCGPTHNVMLMPKSLQIASTNIGAAGRNTASCSGKVRPRLRAWAWSLSTTTDGLRSY